MAFWSRWIFFWGQFMWASAVLASCLCRGDAGRRALENQFALEFGKRGKYPEHQATAGCGGIDHCPFAGEDFQTDAAGGQPRLEQGASRLAVTDGRSSKHPTTRYGATV